MIEPRPPLASVFLALAAMSFVPHFLWEMAQSPLYSSMRGLHFGEASLLCLRASGGDVLISMTAYFVVALAVSDLRWMLRPARWRLAAFTALGIAATILLERHAIGTGRWRYADSMPLVPVFDVGLLPILQWTVLPPLALLAASRLMRRRARGPSGRAAT